MSSMNNTAPQFSMEEALAQSQPPSQGGLFDTASRLGNFYYGAAKTEASKVLSAFSAGFQDQWGASQHQIDQEAQNALKQQKHPSGGNWFTQLTNASQQDWQNWSSVARSQLAAPGSAVAAGFLNAAHQGFSDMGNLPSEEELLKLGFKPDEIHKAYSMVQKSGAGPVIKTLFHGAERGAAPAAAGITLGEAGAAVGGTVAGPAGALVGGIGGGLVGYFGGSEAQNYLLSKLPEKYQELLGQSQKQQQEEQIRHPIATFAGELLPFAATFQPGLLAKAAPQNASLFMKALAHPLGQRALSGVVMGDWEAVQELWNEGHTDSDKVAIAAAIGTFFPRNEALEKVKILNENSNNPRIEPTFTEAKANGVIGAEHTPEQQQAKAEAIAALPNEKTANSEPQVIEGPFSTEEAINSQVSQNYKIAIDAAKQLKAIGRPEDEASATGVLIQHYFETRAARFRGALGTPEELFEKEFPEMVQMQKASALSNDELAQSENGYIAYHGTNRTFDEFNIESRGRNFSNDSKLATFFTSDPEIASDYAHASSIRKNEEGERGVGANVRQSHLALENPQIIDLNDTQYSATDYKEILQKAKDAGHDGVIFKNVHDAVLNSRGRVSTVYAVFDPKKIKSVNAKGELYQDETKSPVFYSALTKSVENLTTKKASSDQWLQTIRNLKGVKKEEIQWSGLEDWLKEQKGSVSKDDVQNFLHENQVRVQDVEKSNSPLSEAEHAEWTRLQAIPATERTDLDWVHMDQLRDKMSRERNDLTKYSQYVLPGGRNYREMLLSLETMQEPVYPKLKEEGWKVKEIPISGEKSHYEIYDERGHHVHNMSGDPGFTEEEILDETAKYFREITAKEPVFTSSHWDEPNVLAHVRFDTRTGSNGEKILHIAELQSDWHQKGRREGYKRNLTSEEQKKLQLLNDQAREASSEYVRAETDEERREYETELRQLSDEQEQIFALAQSDIPNAPFKQSWHELAFKRMLRYAAENGYDKLSWDTGETNADRFDLSRQVGKIIYDHDSRLLKVYDHQGETLMYKDNISPEKLDDYIGKEAADKIKDQINKYPELNASLEGEGLKIGGEGMKGFYDKILPDFARKYTKKWGGKVEDIKLPSHTSQGTFVTMGELQEHGLRNNPFTLEHQLDGAPEGGSVRVRDSRTNELSPEMSYHDAHTYIEKKLAELTAKSVSVHSVTITPKMKDSVLEGQPLFQAGRRGSLVLRDGKNLLKVFANVDASTIIHELGHDWLEALHRDATHPEAPNELINDAATVRTWYNSKRGRGREWIQGEDIPKTAHEMWARGFERYLLEGVAPSKPLTVIFAKFKAWLGKIYQSVSRLKSPINDDVRGVFDRLLSQAPTKTTITSDAEIASRAPQEPLQPLPQDAGTGVPSAENPLPEASKGSTTELAQKSIIDENSRFRINQITGYDDLDRGMKAYITKNANEIIARKGKLTDEDVTNYASSMGLNPKDAKASLDKLKNLFGGPDVPIAGKVKAIGQYLKDATAHSTDMLLNGSKEDILLARQQLVSAMRSFETARTDWGYTGHALQQLYKEADKAGGIDEFFQNVIGKNDREFSQEIDRMRALAKKKGISVEELIKQQRAEASSKIGPMISEYYRSNLITGIFTHTYYAEANKAYAFFKLYPTTAFQAATSSFMSLFNKGIDKVRWGELNEITYNLKSAQADALRAVADSFKAGQSLGMTLPRVAAQKADYELSNGILKQEDYKDRINYLIANPTEEMRLKSTPPKNILQTKTIPGIWGDMVRVGGERMAAPLHSEAYVFMQQLKLSQLIYREAANKGLKGQALAGEIARLKYDTPLDLLQKSRDEALKATLMSNQSQLAKFLTGVSRWKIGQQEFQPLVLFEPFISIAADIFHIAAFDLTPAGIFSKEVRDSALGRNGPEKQAESIGNLMLGTALMGTVWHWLDSGTLTGPAPQDKKKAMIERAIHGYPYSFHVGNEAISIERLGPIGAAIALLADFVQGVRSVDTKSPLGKQIVQAGYGILHNVGSHLLEGIGPFSGFTKLYDIERDQNAFEQWTTKTIAAFEPGSVFQGQIARETDPYQRNVKGSNFWQTVLNQVKAQTPGMSESLPARIDIFGQPIPNVKFEGAYIQQLQNDPVWQYFDRHPNLAPSYTRQPKKFKLDQEQFEEYQMKSGFYLKQGLNKLLSPEFEEMPERLQKEMIQKQVRDARAQAIMELQIKHPELIQQQLDSMKDMFK